MSGQNTKQTARMNSVEYSHDLQNTIQPISKVFSLSILPSLKLFSSSSLSVTSVNANPWDNNINAMIQKNITTDKTFSNECNDMKLSRRKSLQINATNIMLTIYKSMKRENQIMKNLQSNIQHILKFSKLK